MRSKPVRSEGNARRTRNNRVRVATLSALVVLAIAIVGTFAIPRNSSQASQKKYKATKEIVRDQATGELRKPTPEETDAMVSQISVLTNRSAEGLTQTPLAKGGTLMNLEGRFQGVVLGRANADGTTDVRCVFTIEEAADFLGLEQE